MPAREEQGTWKESRSWFGAETAHLLWKSRSLRVKLQLLHNMGKVQLLRS